MSNPLKIHGAEKANPRADTTALERGIDVLVYKLYGLTEDEIRVVEGDNLLFKFGYDRIEVQTQ